MVLFLCCCYNRLYVDMVAEGSDIDSRLSSRYIYAETQAVVERLGEV